MKDERLHTKFILHPSAFILLLALSCARPVSPPHEIHRIISLAPNVTEMTFADGCGAKIVGTDDFSDRPDAAKRIAKVGGVEPDLEKIIALRPDLVIASASSAHPNLRRALGGARIPLLVVRTDRLSEVATAMATIGHTAGCDPGPAVAAFHRGLENQRRFRKNPPRVLFAAWTDPLYVAGKRTFLDDVYVLTGAVNAADVNGWPQYSLESLIQHPPEVLLYPDHSVTREAVGALLGRAHLPIEAVAVDENTFTRPGPRLVDAAAELNRILDQRGQVR